MFIQIHTDNQIESDVERDDRLEGQIRQRLARFEDRVTHVEVHVSDVNGPRGGNSDMRAALEARMNGLQPVAVTDNGPDVQRAVLGAAKKVAVVLERQIGKITDRKGH